ncbi:3-deoxy-D-manno-octulosonic acid transferase [Thiomicrorhabdus sediminis]|uniref:3-deoxy-D-manno-octulosonic acid transferase n=1 Tax=Thiomicrorhabdus sediminis TaxID=2580412 RepID=UPI00143DA917|nr:glycosyltransferase N-terminal domain-containing protein [Thiomicrorhabdus sediminis]
MIYQLLIRILSPLIALAIIVDAYKRNGGWRFIKQRFGFAYTKPNKNADKVLWIHCASIGEVNAAAPLIEQLLNNTPDQALLVSTNTPTGYQYLKSRFADGVLHVYCPLDYPYAIKRLLNSFAISELWVMETEIWPNLFKIASQQRIVIKILNARLSHKTLQAPSWLKNQYRQSLSRVSRILARSDEEREHFISIGADAKKIEVLGNLKYANRPENSATANKIGQPYIVLASSHDPEEAEISKIWIALQRPELLVIAPRHSKRAKQIARQLGEQQISSVFYSQILARSKPLPTKNQVLIIDRMGQLLSLFSQAKLVIMGGSFVAKGGHNILEPASFARAIITGPDMSDFIDETSQLLTDNGLIQCQDYAQLEQQLKALIDNETARNELGKNAQESLKKQTQILPNYLQALGLQ